MQDFFVILIVFAAAAFLVRRMWQAMTKRRSGACGACSNCPSNATSKTPSLVSISPIASPTKAQSGQDFSN
jgi:hypothetical protein